MIRKTRRKTCVFRKDILQKEWKTGNYIAVDVICTNAKAEWNGNSVYVTPREMQHFKQWTKRRISRCVRCPLKTYERNILPESQRNLGRFLQ